MTDILLTGGSGFLGTALRANKIFESARILSRKKIDCKNLIEASLEDCSSFHEALAGIEVVVHVAARAHVMNETSPEFLDLYREVNTLATLRLAEQAASSGVKRFVFISSVKVLGESNEFAKPFTNLDPLNPQDPYARSKAEAELGLMRIADNSDMEVVIIRPPLVYGPNVKGNFRKLLKIVSLSMPLPLASLKNRRSLVSLNNLVDLIVTCITHPKAGNETFMVSDDHDLSTYELLSYISHAVGARNRMFRFPPALLQLFSIIFQKKGIFERLAGSMYVDISYTKARLNWTPPETVQEGIKRCVF